VDSSSAARVIAVARQYVGYTESPSGSNRNQFSERLGGGPRAWCADYVTCMFIEAGMQLPKVDIPQGFTGCPAAVKYADAHVEAIDIRMAKAGDIVLFDWDGGVADHTGILVEPLLANGRLHTIEGNTSISGSQSNGGQVIERSDRLPTQVQRVWRPAFPESQTKDRPVDSVEDDDMIQFMIAPRPDGAWVKAWPVNGGRQLVLVGGRWTDDVPAGSIVEFPAGVFTLDVAKALSKGASGLRGEIRVGDAHGAVTVSDADGDYTWHAA
jgi:hypothetical protein